MGKIPCSGRNKWGCLTGDRTDPQINKHKQRGSDKAHVHRVTRSRRAVTPFSPVELLPAPAEACTSRKFTFGRARAAPSAGSAATLTRAPGALPMLADPTAARLSLCHQSRGHSLLVLPAWRWGGLGGGGASPALLKAGANPSFAIPFHGVSFVSVFSFS